MVIHHASEASVIGGEGELRDKAHLSHLFIVAVWKAEVKVGVLDTVGTSDCTYIAAIMRFVE